MQESREGRGLQMPAIQVSLISKAALSGSAESLEMIQQVPAAKECGSWIEPQTDRRVSLKLPSFRRGHPSVASPHPCLIYATGVSNSPHSGFSHEKQLRT